MTLSEKQGRFAVAVAKLILEIERRGHAVTLGEGYRSPEEAKRLAQAGKGIANSLHTVRLAQDLNLFIGGTYQTGTEAWRPIGEWWEAQSTPELVYCWGGRFNDGNHFSFAHGGYR
jgi:hypothetical protein